jgi:hypothetical protein
VKRAHHARANKRGASALIAGSAAAKQSETTELAYSEPRTVDEPLTWPTRVRKRPMTPRSVAHAGSESGCEQFWRVCSRLDEDQHRQPRHEPIQRHYFESKVPAPPAGSSWLITSTELSLYDSLVWGDQRCRGGDFGTGSQAIRDGYVAQRRVRQRTVCESNSLPADEAGGAILRSVAELCLFQPFAFVH